MAVYCQIVPLLVLCCPRRVSLNDPTWKQSNWTRSPGISASRRPTYCEARCDTWIDGSGSLACWVNN